ncbi:non-ribosomal peptide synthetase [Streptomyces alanosinicus]|uniref:Carrier domain-containing protein n=1 Tax=Streptomyces alanosinicus TaxID=68171 RepID=A0A918YKW3_9ACTN|nr:non-ribosomal peptide synthetase [Streptomyces alanosinicus]GHE06681.1 hypothetical protein GCM10010339_48490 [Streptomyces alanosinicus]
MTAVREAVARFAEETPQAPAVRLGTDELGYAALDRRSRAITARLRKRGISEGDRVVVHMARGLSLLPTVLGVSGAGAAFVPVDARTPARRVRWIAEDCRAALAVTDRSTEANLRGLTGVPSLRADDLLDDIEEPRRHPEDRSTGLAYVLYTSGSTGTPKGVAVRTDAMTEYLDWARTAYQMADGTGAPLFTSIGFDATLTTLLGPLLAGRTVTVVPEDGGDELFQLADLLRGEPDFSFLKATPQHVDLLADILGSTALGRATRRLIVGGDALRARTVRRWHQVCPSVPVVNEYGPTETVVGCTAFTVTPDEVSTLPDDVPIGDAIGATRIYLLSEAGEPVPPGGTGEIFVGGPSAQNVYLGRPGLTAERFLPDPWGSPGSRMYRTGDLGRYDSAGRLVYRGRTDDQVKIRGIRLELGEVEAGITACSGVADACVVSWRDDDGTAVLGAVVVGQDTDTVLAELRERLPAHAIPQRLVRLAAVPLNRHGKADRAAVTDTLRAESGAAAGAAGDDEVQKLVARTMAEVLGCPDLAPDDDFFGRGGDSMLSIRLVAKLRNAGFALYPRDVVAAPTPALLAAVLSPEPENEPGPRVPTAGETVELTPVQRQFFSLDLPNPSHWNQNVLIRVEAGLPWSRFETAARSAFAGRDVLQYRYRRTADGWQQTYVGGAPAVTVEEVVPTATGADPLDGAVRAANATLDIGDGPLAKAVLIRGPEADHVLLVAHHLVVDAVSWTILLDDLVTSYRLGAEDPARTKRVPARGGDFARWAAALGEFARRPEVSARRSAWDGIPAPSTGGLGGPAIAAAPDDYAFERRRPGGLDSEETRRVERAGEAGNLKLQEVLLAAAARALSEVFGDDVLRLDVESHGRTDGLGELDVSRTMGWFTSVFPVALSGGQALSELLDRARRALREQPWDGIDFGISRPGPHGEGPDRSPVLFNFLGRTERTVAADLGWTLVDPPLGVQVPPAGRRPYPLELQARVVDGALTWHWVHGRHQAAETVDKLSGRLREALLACAEELDRSRTLQFEASGLPADELGALLAGFGHSGESDGGESR